MLGPVGRISNQLGRNAMRNFATNHHSKGGIPGENLPFDIHNKKRLTFNLFWYVGTAMALPFLVVHWQLKKKL